MTINNFGYLLGKKGFTKIANPQRHQQYGKNGSRLPTQITVALAEIEETAELIYDEVEEITAELLHQNFALADTVPTDLILQTLLHQLLKCIRQVMNVDTVTVLLKTEGGRRLAVRATLGLEEEITERIMIPLGHGFAGRIATSCEVTIIDDLSKIEVVSPILRNKGIRSMLGVPLLIENRIAGVFHVGTVHPRKFTQAEAQLLKLVAEHVGLTLDRLVVSSSFIAEHLAVVKQKFALPSLNPLSGIHFQRSVFEHTDCNQGLDSESAAEVRTHVMAMYNKLLCNEQYLWC